MRRTLLVHNLYARRLERYACAKRHEIGTAILTIEHLAVRLAGGLLEAIDRETLFDVLPDALEGDLGEFETIKLLPGFRRTVVDTLSKAWRGGIDFLEPPSSAAQSRFAALAALEAALLAALPARMLRPHALVARSLARINLAPQLVGSLHIHGHTELEVVWRPLVLALAEVIEVRWIAGPRHVPTWVLEANLPVERSAATTPQRRAEVCANPHHEVLEALRWARGLLATGVAQPHEIALCAAALEAWDDHFAVLREACDIPLHFVQGIPALDTLEGQTVMALADVLLQGLSRARLTRLVELLRLEQSERFRAIPDGWHAGLPECAPLEHRLQWNKALATMEPPLNAPARAALAAILDAIAALRHDPLAAGQQLCSAQSTALLKRALARGPLQGIAATLKMLRVQDMQVPPEVAVIWGPAAALAAAPRPYVWLLGLHAGSWPRAASEDPLLPGHLVASTVIDPLPLHEADRRDFASIVGTTTHEVVYSCASRNAAGKKLGISPLYPADLPKNRRNRTRIPQTAASESDRFFARPQEFGQMAVALQAARCWENWNRAEMTAHDGLMPADHPLVLSALHRRHSASSLKLLLCDPLGYLWKYGFRWSMPEAPRRALTMDPAAFGNLLHAVLETSVQRLQNQGLARGAVVAEQDASELRALLHEVLVEQGERWAAAYPTPPGLLWQLTLEQIEELAYSVLTFAEPALAGQRSWTEIRFGAQPPRPGDVEGATDFPWDPERAVCIPQTNLQIGGYIDRLDLSADGSCARVTDYKSGQPPKVADLELDGGLELQRVLYACAVVQLIPSVGHIEARLLYPRASQATNGGLYELADVSETLYVLSTYLREAQHHVRSGHTVVGRMSDQNGRALDPLALFALPSGALTWYQKRKTPALRALLGILPQLWELK